MPYLVSKFPTLSSQSLEIQLPLCSQKPTFFSRYTHKAKGRGKLMERDLAQLFPSLSPIWRQREGICLQNCCGRNVVCFPNPVLDCSNLSYESQPWGLAGAEQRPHEPFEMWESHAVPYELYQLHICFQMQSSWCVLNYINSGFLRNWASLCSSAGVLLLTAPAFIFQGHEGAVGLTCYFPPVSTQIFFRTSSGPFVWKAHPLPRWFRYQGTEMHYYYSCMTLIS